MSIASEITRIQNGKNSIIAAMTRVGITVPSGALINELPPLLDENIESVTSNTSTIADNISRIRGSKVQFRAALDSDGTHISENVSFDDIAKFILGSHSMDISCPSILAGDPLVVSVSLPEAAGGNCTLEINNSVVSGTVNEGIVSFTVNNLPAGNYPFVVKYAGNASVPAMNMYGTAEVFS